MNRRRHHGQSLVEFALVLPVLLLMIFGVVDGARLVYAYNAVANAAREAGRTAIINQTPATIRAKASQQATMLDLPTGDPGGCPAAGGASSSAAAGTCVAFRTADLSAACTTPKVGCNAVVSVEWQWRAMTPLIGNVLGPISVTSTTTQAIESACVGNACLDR